MNEVLSVLYQSLMSFFILFLISKILGKKQVAQLEFTDYVIGISIGSIAAQMSIEPEVPWFHFVIAMSIYATFDLAITLISRKSKLLKKIFKGKRLIIINQGKISYKELKKSKLDIHELISQCRVKGFFDLSKIEYCIFEPSGDFSILANAESQTVSNKDIGVSKKEEALQIDFIVDGEVIQKKLQEHGKDMNWLYQKTKLKSKREIKKNVILFLYDPSKDSFQMFEK